MPQGDPACFFDDGHLGADTVKMGKGRPMQKHGRRGGIGVLARRVGRRSARGQAALEYVLLFAAVAAVTLISVTAFDNDVRTTLEGFFNAAANQMALP